jgi:DNA-binding NarL/FixJ family response regulator
MLATSVAAGVALAADEKVDLLILDLKLPDGDGLDVLRGAVKRNGDVACIVLSSMAEELICPQDLAPRVVVVIDKTAAIESLRFEVEAVVRRRLGGSPRARTRDVAKLLRPRELEVFERIGKGMSTRAIAESLGITAHTVNTHRKAIVSKLGVVGAELVRLATIYNHTHPATLGSPRPRR